MAVIFMAVMAVSIIAIQRWATRHAQTVRNPGEATQRWLRWAAVPVNFLVLKQVFNLALPTRGSERVGFRNQQMA
jgi:hypothetical protein